jgi:F-type H+-transporting ATPase subunit gamma
MDTLENIRNKSVSATDLKSVVRSMKAMAASNIAQYDIAAASLGDYFHTVALGFIAYLKEQKIDAIYERKESNKNKEQPICAIVFGSDQGLVGQFNDSMTAFVDSSLKALPDKKEIWVIGERVQLLLSDTGLTSNAFYQVPNNVGEITALIQKILIQIEEGYEKNNLEAFYIFHHQSKPGSGYEPVMQRLLPFDEKWRRDFTELHWPTNILPQIAGGTKPTLLALIREYLFVSLFKACAESLASENNSRLEAMQRAEKNIDDLLDDLDKKYKRIRQSTIDEELFDVISGFEALKKSSKKNSNI